MFWYKKQQADLFCVLGVEGVWLLWWLPVAGVVAAAVAAEEILLGTAGADGADVAILAVMPFCLELLSVVTGAADT